MINLGKVSTETKSPKSGRPESATTTQGVPL
jgi:hypothetical protein